MTIPEHQRGLRDAPLGPPAAPAPAAPYPTPTASVPPRKRPTALIIGGLAAVVLVATAGGYFASTAFHHTPSSPAAASPAAPSAAPVAVTSSADAPAPSVAPRLKLGQTYAHSAEANSTAYAYRQPVASSAPKPDTAGYVWAAIDVKVCALANSSGNTITVSNQPWSLAYADGSLIEPSSIGYRQFPQPEYPWGERAVPWGHCVRGWITFAVPHDKRPVAIEYQVQAGTVDWAL